MPYSIPTLTELYALALQDVQAASISGVDGLLQRAVLRVLTRSISGLAYEHYGYQAYIARNAVPWTAEDEWLTGWAALKGVSQKPATSAVMSFSFTGAPGTPMPAGTAINTLNSLEFITTAAASVPAGGVLLIAGTAASTGSAYNLAVGTLVSLGSAIPGINASGSVAAILTAAADLEAVPAFRTRTLQTYADPPQGGSAGDYVLWAEAVPGCTRAWCNPNGAGAGTVVVYVMCDVTEAATGGFPQGSNGVAALETRAAVATGDQLTVANAILPLQPVTALVYVVSPNQAAVPVAIQNLLPNTAAIAAAVQAALGDLFLRIGSPLGMTLYPSDINEAIASVPGIVHFTAATPNAATVIPLGSLPVLGAFTTQA